MPSGGKRKGAGRKAGVLKRQFNVSIPVAHFEEVKQRIKEMLNEYLNI